MAGIVESVSTSFQLQDYQLLRNKIENLSKDNNPIMVDIKHEPFTTGLVITIIDKTRTQREFLLTGVVYARGDNGYITGNITDTETGKKEKVPVARMETRPIDCVNQFATNVVDVVRSL